MRSHQGYVVAALLLALGGDAVQLAPRTAARRLLPRRHAAVRSCVKLSAAASPPRDLSGDGGCMLRTVAPPLSGAEAIEDGNIVRVHFSATLANGTLLHSSRDADESLEVRVGAEPSDTTPGWELALRAMKVGERAQLTCAPQYAYGADGAPPLIPPNATIDFDLEVLSLRDLRTSNDTSMEGASMEDRYARMMADIEAKERARGVASPDAEDEAEATVAEAAEPLIVDDEGDDDLRSAHPSSGGAADGVADGMPAEAPAGVPGQRGWVPSKTRLKASSPSGLEWRETDEEMEVSLPLPPGASAADVSVDFGTSSIDVSVLGETRLSGELCGAIVRDLSSWSVEAADADGDPATLQLDLWKRDSAAQLWGYVLAEERDRAK